MVNLESGWRRESPRVAVGFSEPTTPDEVFKTALELVGCDRHAAVFRGIEYQKSMDDTFRMSYGESGTLIFHMPDDARLDEALQALHYFLTCLLAKRYLSGESLHWQEDGRVVEMQSRNARDGFQEILDEVVFMRQHPQALLADGDNIERIDWVAQEYIREDIEETLRDTSKTQ